MKKTYTVDGMVVAVNLVMRIFGHSQTIESLTERLRDIQQEFEDETADVQGWVDDLGVEYDAHGPDPYVNPGQDGALAVLVYREFEFACDFDAKTFVGHLKKHEYEEEKNG